VGVFGGWWFWGFLGMVFVGDYFGLMFCGCGWGGFLVVSRMSLRVLLCCVG